MSKLLCLALCAACFDPQYTDATQCGPGGECPAGRRCVADHCVVGGGGPDARGPDAPPGGPYHIVISKSGARAADATLTQLLPAPVTVCQAGCPGLEIDVDPGNLVMVGASPGTGAYFSGFDGPCSPPSRTCQFQPTGPVSLAAHFENIDHNLVFVTSEPLPSTGGGLQAADRFCADRAAAGPLSGTFVAILSDSTTAVVNRLRTARGFVRLDGLAIADTIAQLVMQHRLWYPILFDEYGNAVKGDAWYGSDQNGQPLTADLNCASWTVSGTGVAASTAGNLGALYIYNCTEPHPIFCAMVDRTAPVSQSVISAGKLLVVSTQEWDPSTGSGKAQDACTAEAVSGHALRALIADTQPASAMLVPGQLYVRGDGVPIGTGAEILAGTPRTGIWTHRNGDPYLGELVWTGSESVTLPAGDGSCGNWSSVQGYGLVGQAVANGNWWFAGPEQCSDKYPVYCVEP